MPRRRPLRIASLIPPAVALIVAACTPGGTGGIHRLPPPPTLAATSTTAPPPDFGGVALAEVPGRTTTTIEVGPGEATLEGTVVADEGPVANAIVRVQRVVGEGSAHLDVLTAEDGTWVAPFLKGGVVRVRAWRAPDLALAETNVFFLEGRETRRLDLRLEKFTGLRVTSDMAPDPPTVGEAANLIVQVTNEAVDGEGVVRAQVVAGINVELFGSGNWRVATDNPTTTDAAGNARFTLRCDQAGQQPLSVVVGDIQSLPIGVPDCAPSATTSTTSTTVSSSTTASRSTSSTTSTTRRRSDED